MDSGKKIMIIGAGAGQVPIIRASKGRGLITLVVSPDGPYPGIKEADKWLPIDIYDKESVLAAARSERIDYVISDQSDFAVPTVAYVAENMGILGNSIKTAEIYSDKSIQREFCEHFSLPVPKSYALDGELSLNNVPFNFPWIIKPADSQGSRGISKVSSIQDGINAYKEAIAFSKKRKVVVEEFFQGKEVVCEGLIIDGEYYNIAFADREYFDLENKFIPSKTIFPSQIDENIKQRIIANDAAFVLHSEAKFGIMHSEYIVDSLGNFRMVETALRGGGVYISSHLVPICTGIDLTAVLLDYILFGREAALKTIEKSRKQKQEYSAYVCFYLKQGVVSSVEGLSEIRQMPNIILSEVDNIIPGFEYSGLEHKGKRLGPFIISAESYANLLYIIKQIQAVYKVRIDGCSDNVVFWD